MILGIDNNKEEIIEKEFEKEFDEVYRKFVRTKGAISRRFNTRFKELPVVLALIAVFLLLVYFKLPLLLLLLCLVVYAFLSIRGVKSEKIDSHINRMLISRVSKDIEYKEYPFVFDKEIFLKITNHTYLPVVRYNREILINDKENGLEIRNIELSSCPDYLYTSDGMFAYTENDSKKYPRIVIRKIATFKEPTFENEDYFKYSFDISGKENIDEIRNKIESNNFIEKLKVYTKFYNNADIYIDNNMISIYCYQKYKATGGGGRDNLTDTTEWYSYTYGKDYYDDYHNEDKKYNDYFLKTNKKFTRYNYYRWFGPIKIVEELTKIL